MNIPWYEIVDALIPITQGDIIMNCPVVTWGESSPVIEGETKPEEILKANIDYVSIDAVVMTQACDLAENKVKYVILCPHYDIEEHKYQWEIAMRQSYQNPTSKAWGSYIEEIRQGRIWSLSMINAYDESSLRLDIRIVDFREIFSLPRNFLEGWVVQQGRRFRLLPPYREHLSQAFARFFMRVGLPVDIPKFK
jgi:hypothetical protein